MHTSMHTESQLAIARADAIDRQRQAERYRAARELRERSRFRPGALAVTAVLTTVAAIGLLSVDTAAPAVADVIPIEFEEPLPWGLDPGEADGWFVPGEE